MKIGSWNYREKKTQREVKHFLVFFFKNFPRSGILYLFCFHREHDDGDDEVIRRVRTVWR